MRNALILFAHGSRDPRWAAPFEAVAARLREQRPGLAVRLAYLELMAPGLEEVGAELAHAGCRSLQVLPMFLGIGAHLRRDLPLRLDALRAAHPGLQVALLPSVGEIDHVVAAMAEAALGLLDTPS